MENGDEKGEKKTWRYRKLGKEEAKEGESKESRLKKRAKGIIEKGKKNQGIIMTPGGKEEKEM